MDEERKEQWEFVNEAFNGMFGARRPARRKLNLDIEKTPEEDAAEREYLRQGRLR